MIVQRVQKEEWLALGDDFRTHGISQTLAELPKFDLSIDSVPQLLIAKSTRRVFVAAKRRN